MYPKHHILLGLIFAGILLIAFPQIGFLGFTIIWASSVLIDVDHYLFYGFTKKDWSLKNAYQWFVEKNKEFLALPKKERKKCAKTIPCIFHGIELSLILIGLCFILPNNLSAFSLFIFTGFFLHNALDFVYAIKEGFPLDHSGSQIKNWRKFLKNSSSNNLL